MEALGKLAAALPPANFEEPCDCDYCMLQYAGHKSSAGQDLKYEGYLSNEAAAKKAAEYTERIQQARDHIAYMTNNHGNAILKKWRRDQQYRRKTLQKVKADIYPTRDPLLNMLGTPNSTSSEDLADNRMALLLPYINLEDLIEDSSHLISLLHNRSRYPPEQWVPFDNSQLQPAWRQAVLPELFAYGCVEMHGPDYGTWKAFSDGEVHRGDAHGTPRGLLILEAQEALLSFLRAMVDEIYGKAVLPEIQSTPIAALLFPSTAPTAACDKWMPFLNSPSSREVARSSFGSAFAQQPFSSPPGFNIETLLDIAETRAAQAKDELWLLQTDLEYFLSVVGYFESQWFDKVPGITEMRVLLPEEKYDNVGHIVTEKVLIRAADWQWLVKLCLCVKREIESSTEEICPGVDLPAVYERELGCLFTLVKNCLQREQDDLQRLTFKSAEFQHIFNVKRTIDTSQGRDWALEFEFKDYQHAHRAEPMGWCFYHLMQDSERSASFENGSVLQHLDNILISQPAKEAERLDQEIYRCLSDIAALERMADLLEYHRPLFNLPDDEELRHDPRQVFQIKNKLHQVRRVGNPAVGLGSALQPLCEFSLPQRKDTKWLTQRDRGYQLLGNLWSVARAAYQAKLQAASISQKFIIPQLALMQECTSPEHEARLASERSQIIDQIRAANDLRRAEIDQTVKQSAGLLPSQEKAKDKKQAKAPTATPNIKPHPEGESSRNTSGAGSWESWSPILYRLPETSIAWQVVRRMFPDRSEGTEDGSRTTTTWKEFLTAMSTLGFSAEPNGGSMYRFQGNIMIPVPNANPESKKRKLGVHRLHANGDMHPNFLQAIGKRCTKNFGWERDLFALMEDVT